MTNIRIPSHFQLTAGSLVEVTPTGGGNGDFLAAAEDALWFLGGFRFVMIDVPATDPEIVTENRQSGSVSPFSRLPYIMDLLGRRNASRLRGTSLDMKHIKLITGTALAAILCTSTMAGAQLQGGVTRTKTSTSTSTNGGIGGYLKTHPKVKGAAIGTAAGAGIGAATGLITGKGTMRGAGIGAVTGAGVGVMSGSKILKKHPVVKTTAMGTAAGVGLGLAASKGRGTGKKAATAGAVGGAVGLGLGFLNEKLKD
jgi:hypothetical protein